MTNKHDIAFDMALEYVKSVGSNELENKLCKFAAENNVFVCFSGEGVAVDEDFIYVDQLLTDDELYYWPW